MTISQYFVYKRPIAWTLLFATMAGGFAAFRSMPQRQDPVIQIRLGLVSTEYPGASPIEVEQEVSRKIEKKLAENPAVEHVRSTSRQGLSTVFADLYESTRNAEAVWQDLDNKLAAMTDLPVANGVPLKPRLDKDFGDTVAVMLTLSSPPVSDLEVERRAEVIAEKISAARAARPESLRGRRYSGVLVHPSTVDSGMLERLGRACLEHLEGLGLVEDGQTIPLLGAMLLDFRLADGRDPAAMRHEIRRWESDNVANGLGHPDIWPGVIVGDPSELLGELKARCQAEPGGVARYSYEELHRFADMIQDRLRQSTKVGKIEQLGVVGERVYLYYSNRRLSSSAPTCPTSSAGSRSGITTRAAAWSNSPGRTSRSSRAASFGATATSATSSSTSTTGPRSISATSSRWSGATTTRRSSSTSGRSNSIATILRPRSTPSPPCRPPGRRGGAEASRRRHPVVDVQGDHAGDPPGQGDADRRLRPRARRRPRLAQGRSAR